LFAGAVLLPTGVSGTVRGMRSSVFDVLVDLTAIVHAFALLLAEVDEIGSDVLDLLEMKFAMASSVVDVVGLPEVVIGVLVGGNVMVGLGVGMKGGRVKGCLDG
jgi:hypothetical protein